MLIEWIIPFVLIEFAKERVLNASVRSACPVAVVVVALAGEDSGCHASPSFMDRRR